MQSTSQLQQCVKSLSLRFIHPQPTESQEPGLSTSDMSASEATLQALAKLLDVHVIPLQDRTVPASTAKSTGPGGGGGGGGGGGKKRQRKRSGRNTKTEEVAVDGEQKAENSTIPAVEPPTTSAGGEWLVKDFLLRRAIGEHDFIDIR